MQHAAVVYTIIISAHRSIAVHPTLPYLLTSSDDMLIKLWDWDKVRGFTVCR